MFPETALAGKWAVPTLVDILIRSHLQFVNYTYLEIFISSEMLLFGLLIFFRVPPYGNICSAEACS